MGVGGGRWESVGVGGSRWESVGVGGSRWELMGVRGESGGSPVGVRWESGESRWESVGVGGSRWESVGVGRSRGIRGESGGFGGIQVVFFLGGGDFFWGKGESGGVGVGLRLVCGWSAVGLN